MSTEPCSQVGRHRGLERSNRLRMEALARAALVIANQDDCEGVARALLATAIEQADAEAGAIMLFAEHKAEGLEDDLAVALTLSAPQEMLQPPHRIIREAIRRLSPIRLDCLSGISAFSQSDAPARAVSILCLPLCRHSTVLGVLYLEATAGTCLFSPSEIEFLRAVLAQAAICIESNRRAERLALETAARLAAETALREATNAMVRHQQIGRMGDFRYDTVSNLITGSLESNTMFGFDPSLDHIAFADWMERIHVDDRQRFRTMLDASIARITPLRAEFRIILNGEMKNVVCEAQPQSDQIGLAYYGVLIDVSERKAAERAFQESQAELAMALKLAAIGELAGSIIHEINQPLTAVVTSTEACGRWLDQIPPKLDEARSSVERSVSEARRVAAVVEGLHGLVRGSDASLAMIQLNDAIREVLGLVATEAISEGITLSTELEPELPNVRAARVQVQQVVLNLLRNGIEAMRDIEGRPKLLRVSSSLLTDGSVSVAITDNGNGAPHDVMERLFDQMFTTKKGGMGIGLSISRKIIAAHFGRIWAENLDPHGMTFHFTIPVASGLV